MDLASGFTSVGRRFVLHEAAQKITATEALDIDGTALRERLRFLFGGVFDELTFARHLQQWLAHQDKHARELETARCYAAWAVHTPAGQALHRADVLFRIPRP